MDSHSTALLGANKQDAFKRSSSSLSLPRDAFVAYLEWRSSRQKVLRQVPLSLLMYVLFAVGIVLRVRIGACFSFESQLVASVVKADNVTFVVKSPSDWYRWVNASLVQGILETSGPDGVPLPKTSLGRLANGVGLIVGGVRLLQTRRALVPCPLSTADLVSLYGAPCYGDDIVASDAFGNLTVAQQYGVERAFYPTTDDGYDGHAEYQLFLNPEEGTQALMTYISGLRAAGWIDHGTATVGVQIALLNGNVGLFGRVELLTEFTLGGGVLITNSVQSMPVDPYFASPWNVAFDVFFWGYSLYLLVGTVRRFVKALRSPRVQRLDGRWRKVSRVLWDYWRVLDIAATACLVCTLGVWYATVASLARIRDYIDRAHPRGPSDFSGGPSPLSSMLFDAHADFFMFKAWAIAMILLMTLRIFKYFKFQPRLAVLSKAVASGLSDFLHVSLVFGLVLAGFGITGHFAFGNQAPDWRDIKASLVAIFKMSVYILDLPAMQAAFPDMADAFTCTFMILVTNAFYWLAFAAVFASYDAARIAARQQGPSAFLDLWWYLRTLPREAWMMAIAPALAFCSRLCGMDRCCRRFLPSPNAISSGAAAKIVMHAVQTKGALSAATTPVVSVSMLGSAPFFLAPETAVSMMKEAILFVKAAESSAARARADALALGMSIDAPILSAFHGTTKEGFEPSTLASQATGDSFSTGFQSSQAYGLSSNAIGSSVSLTSLDEVDDDDYHSADEAKLYPGFYAAAVAAARGPVSSNVSQAAFPVGSQPYASGLHGAPVVYSGPGRPASANAATAVAPANAPTADLSLLGFGSYGLPTRSADVVALQTAIIDMSKQLAEQSKLISALLCERTPQTAKAAVS